MLFRHFFLFLGLSHAAILRSKDLQMSITQLLTVKDLVKTQLIDKKWIDIGKVFERITPNAGLFENKQTCELVFETKENSWTQIELVKNLKVFPNFQSLIEERNWDEVFLELISVMKRLVPYRINRLVPFGLQQKRLADEFCEALAHVVNGKVLHALGESPIINTHLLEILLKRSEISPDIKNAAGQTPLHTVAEDCGWNDASIDVVEILLKHGAEIDPTDNNSMTPLMMASKTPNVTVVEALRAHGANPNLTDKHHQTCLHHATQDFASHNVVIELLSNPRVEHKPEIDAADNEGRTPLMIAAENGIEYAVSWLLMYGASPNLRDEYGKTALHYAAAEYENHYMYHDYDGVFEVLLEFKADPYAIDNQLKTPLMLAERVTRFNKTYNPLIGNMVEREEIKMNKLLEQKLKQIKRKRKKLFPKQNLKSMSED